MRTGIALTAPRGDWGALLEPAPPGDHLVQAQQASLVEVDVLRHVDLEAVRAHAAALDALLPQEHAALELELLTDRDHADHRRGAARADTLEGLLGGLLEADRLEGVLDATAGELADRLDRIALGGVHRVGCAELTRLRELLLEDVDGDDHPGARDARALDDGQADAAGAVHRHRRAGLDAGRVEHRADSGRHAAADQRAPVERHVVADFDEPVFVDQHFLGIGGQIRELIHRRAVPAELGRLLRCPDGPRLAEVGPSGQAVAAVPAEDRQAGDHVIAGLELRHVLAHLLDDPGGLVAEDRGRGERIVAVDEVQVAVAHAARDRAHEHFAPDGLRDVDVLDGERLLGAMEHGGFHGQLLSRAGGR